MKRILGIIIALFTCISTNAIDYHKLLENASAQQLALLFNDKHMAKNIAHDLHIAYCSPALQQQCLQHPLFARKIISRVLQYPHYYRESLPIMTKSPFYIDTLLAFPFNSQGNADLVVKTLVDANQTDLFLEKIKTTIATPLNPLLLQAALNHPSLQKPLETLLVATYTAHPFWYNTIGSLDSMSLLFRYYRDYPTITLLGNRMISNGTAYFKPFITQTEAHCWANGPLVARNIEYIMNLNLNSNIMNLFDNTLAHEKELVQEGKYVFYHAQRWELYFLEDIYTKLWELKYKTPATNYLFTRFVPHIHSPAKLESELIDATILRENLLRNGREYGNRGDLLFVNYALLGNTGDSGSCTAHYLFENTNCANTDHLNLSYIIGKELDEPLLYVKYQQEFSELKQEFLTLSKHGNLLQISMTPEALKKSVFVAHPGGYKRSVEIQDSGKTSDVQHIIDTLKKAPHTITDSDRIEFCIILTRDFVLQPNNGIEFFSFNDVDPVAWQQYVSKRDTLLEKIKADIKNSTNQAISVQNLKLQIKKMIFTTSFRARKAVARFVEDGLGFVGFCAIMAGGYLFVKDTLDSSYRAGFQDGLKNGMNLARDYLTATPQTAL